MDVNNQKPLIEATGGIHIEVSFIRSFQASIPCGKLEKNFILKIFSFIGKIPGMIGSYKDIPRVIQLQYNEIKEYKENNLSILGYGIAVVHNNTKYPPFLQVWI